MIYAYLSDEAFAVTGTRSVLTYSTISSNGYAVPTDKVMNYFDTVLKKGSTTDFLVQHGIIVDPVFENEDHAYESNYRNNRLVVDSTNSAFPIGTIMLHFDRTKLTDENDLTFVNEITILEQDIATENTRANKTNIRACLFNIIEAVYMAHNTKSEGSTPYTVEQLETLFSAASNTTYKGYVPGSLKLASTVSSVNYRYVDKNKFSVTEKHDFYDYFEFSFKYGSIGTEVSFKIWLNNISFLENYPYSTIIDVLYPCNPAWILRPEESGGEVQAVIAAARYKDNQIDTAVTANDHSGASIYTSKYNHPIVGSNSRMSFVIMYKGIEPTSADMRLAVRNALTSEVDNYGNKLASDREWKNVLPDLFIDAEFYLIPCYFQRKIYNSRVFIEKSIVNYKSLFNKTVKLFPNGNTQKIFDYMEILQAPGHDLYLIALPVELSKDDIVPQYTNVLSLHPSYQSIDAVGTVKSYQKTDDTRYQNGTTYYYRDGSSPIYEYTEVDSSTYKVGDFIPESAVLYELVVEPAGYWNCMTTITKEFAQLLANCLTVCLDENSSHVKDFTESVIDGRKYYTFGCNSIEYHMLSLAGASGIFDDENMGE